MEMRAYVRGLASVCRDLTDGHAPCYIVVNVCLCLKDISPGLV